MPEFKLATAYVELKSKGKLAEELQKQKAGVDSLSKALKSGEFAKFAKTQAALSKSMEALKKQASWKELVATNGLLGAVAETAKTKIQAAGEQLGKFKNAALGAFAAGSAGVLGAVAAASPTTFDTFTGSIKILAASVGQIFVPMMVEASYWIQRVAYAIRTMDPDTKESIATWTKWGLGILATIAIISRLSPVLTLIIQGIRLLGSVLAFTFANPQIAAIMAMAAAFVYLKSQIDAVVASMDELANKFGHEGVSKEEYESNPVVRQAKAMKDAGKSNQEISNYLQGQIAREQKLVTDAVNASTSYANIGRIGKAQTASEEAATHSKQITIFQKARMEVLHKQAPELIGAAKGAAGNAGGFNFALGKPQAQAAILNIEQAREHAMMAAMSQSPIDAQILKLQMDSLPIMAQAAKKFLEAGDHKPPKFVMAQ